MDEQAWCMIRYDLFASGEIQTLESAGSADITLQTASYGGTKRQIPTTSQPLLLLSPHFSRCRLRLEQCLRGFFAIPSCAEVEIPGPLKSV